MKKLKLFFILIISVSVFCGNNFAQTNANIIERDNLTYFKNMLVIKLKTLPSTSADKSVNLNSALSKRLEPFGIKSAKQYLPFQTKSESSLNRVIVIEYENEIDPFLLAAKLKNADEIEWAEPRFIRKLDYTPNDPLIGNQYHLTKISAHQAWDINKGDSSIIIGIIDTGVDWDHPDLAANIWQNKNEIAGNGIDDDSNGFIDDTRGWDFGGLDGTADNNPMEDGAHHGTFVAGVASSVTDNGIGIASIGFNSTIMPVKTAREDMKNTDGIPFIVYGFEGIVYAADNGARIINCSFGGSGYSILAQEVIDYAIKNGALVVAAAGNDNSSEAFYPSAYEGVLSVASTDQGDIRSSFSNYGTTVDVSAPGSNIYSTWQSDTYRFGNGTSFSSPLAAGLAALVAAQFPLYSPLQIAEQIRVNTDNINSQNPNYQNLLGTGRINAFKSLSNNNSISVRAVEFEFSDAAPGGNGNGIFQSGETISIGVRFINFLNPTSNLNVFLESLNSNAAVQNGSFNAGALSTLDSFDNFSSRFTVTLSASLPQNAKLLFNLNFLDGSYIDFQPFGTVGNPTFATQAGTDVSMTITSKGTLGFNDYSSNLNGTGFHYLNGGNLLFEGALILGTSAANISDAARAADQSVQSNNFTVVQPFILNIPGTAADQQGSAIFNDDAAGGNKIGVTVNLQSYSYSNEPHQNYIILNYGLTNNSGAEINNLFAGLFFDWDLVDGSGLDDLTAFDDQGKLGYAFHPAGTPDNYVGSALISSEDYGFWGILNPGGDGGFQIYDGFTDAEKWQAISSGIGKQQAGAGDISHVTSGGPFNIPAGETINVAFAVGAAPDLEGIRNTIANSRIKYQSIITDVEDEIEIPFIYNLSQNYPNPFNPTTSIQYAVGDKQFVSLKVYDILGNEIATLVNKEQPAGEYEIEFKANNLSSGIYFYKIQAGEFIEGRKMMLLK